MSGPRGFGFSAVLVINRVNNDARLILRKKLNGVQTESKELQPWIGSRQHGVASYMKYSADKHILIKCRW